nr:receptor-like protein 18 [Ziziphus jujuba var. spinosa]
MTEMNKGLEMVVLVKIVTTFTSIGLSNNNFSGEIPRSIWNLQSFHVLNLSGNNFRGPIPSWFEKLREVESLDLSKNKFSGRIPQQLVKLTFLAYLNLSQNHFNGFIPQGGQFATFLSSAFNEAQVYVAYLWPKNVKITIYQVPSRTRKCNQE